MDKFKDLSRVSFVLHGSSVKGNLDENLRIRDMELFLFSEGVTQNALVVFFGAC